MNLVKNPTNVLCGLVFLVLGGIFAFESSGLKLGTAGQMGPGFFPLVLSGVLSLFGVLLVAIGLRVSGHVRGTIAWRGFLQLILAVVVFAAAIRPLGFLPAVAGSVLLAFFGSKLFSARAALLLVASVTLFCWLVFIKGLGLPIELLGPWLSGD